MSTQLKVNAALQKKGCKGVNTTVTDSKLTVTIQNQPISVVETKSIIQGIIGTTWKIHKATSGYYLFVR